MITFNKDKDAFDACDASSNASECNKGFFIDDGDVSGILALKALMLCVIGI